jgi:tRNA-specific 2-thiouridylase
MLGDINWLGDGVAAGDLTVKIRSMALPVAAQLVGETLSFAAPEFGVAPGQAAVFYAGSRVLGGGVIRHTHAVRQIIDASMV